VAPADLSLRWPDAVELVRTRRGDVFEIQFLGREYERLRSNPEPEVAARAAETRERLRAVIEHRLRTKGLLDRHSRLELVDSP
jgi:hypothetical protein